MQGGGAGVSAAELVANEHINAIITVNMGPKAFSVFSNLGIDIYHATGNIKEAVEDFIKGKLQKIGDATGPRHMSQ